MILYFEIPKESGPDVSNFLIYKLLFHASQTTSF